MILEAVRIDDRTVVATAGGIPSLASSVCAALDRFDLPRIQVFHVTRNDRTWLWDFERELSRELLFKHDCMTAPIGDRIRETCDWAAHNIGSDLNQDQIAKRIAMSFGVEKLGVRTVAYAWHCYQVACQHGIRTDCHQSRDSGT